MCTIPLVKSSEVIIRVFAGGRLMSFQGYYPSVSCRAPPIVRGGKTGWALGSEAIESTLPSMTNPRIGKKALAG